MKAKNIVIAVATLAVVVAVIMLGEDLIVTMEYPLQESEVVGIYKARKTDRWVVATADTAFALVTVRVLVNPERALADSTWEREDGLDKTEVGK